LKKVDENFPQGARHELTDKSKFEAFGIQESDVGVGVDADGDDIRLFCKSGGKTMENDLFLWIGGVLVEVF
jgi:hypothetical protein